jgi:hypothetical protein
MGEEREHPPWRPWALGREAVAGAARPPVGTHRFRGHGARVRASGVWRREEWPTREGEGRWHYVFGRWRLGPSEDSALLRALESR